MQDGLLVGLAYGAAHVWLLVLQLLRLVEARVDSERLKLRARQPLPTRIITLLTTKQKGDVLPWFNISFFKKSLGTTLLQGSNLAGARGPTGPHIYCRAPRFPTPVGPTGPQIKLINNGLTTLYPRGQGTENFISKL